MGIIVTELITNAMKHAFADDARGELSVYAERDGSTCVLTVRDNGPGAVVGDEERNSDGFGITLITSLVERAGGDFVVESDAGMKATARYPISEWERSSRDETLPPGA
jgi:two-component sensor histidine kinase